MKITTLSEVTCGLRFQLFFVLFFSAPDCWCLFKGIVVHQLWSSAFSRRDKARAVAGMARHVFFFEQLGWCPPASWCPKQTAYSAYRERRYWFLSPTISFISHRPDHKGTLARTSKGPKYQWCKYPLGIAPFIKSKFIPVMQIWIFSIITPIFSVTWSFRNHSNILICCSRKNSYYYHCWKQLCCLIFLSNIYF